MKVLKIESLEELVELIDEVWDKPSLATTEKVWERFRRSCRLAYGVTRRALDPEEPAVRILHTMSVKHYAESEGIDAATAALIMSTVGQYLEFKQQENPELFKQEIIKFLDLSVQEAGDHIEKVNDARTKSSNESGSAQSS